MSNDRGSPGRGQYQSPKIEQCLRTSRLISRRWTCIVEGIDIILEPEAGAGVLILGMLVDLRHLLMLSQPRYRSPLPYSLYLLSASSVPAR